jgi:hypothetical protein
MKRRLPRAIAVVVTVLAIAIGAVLLWPSSDAPGSAAPADDATGAPTVVSSTPTPADEGSAAPERAGSSVRIVAAGDVACDPSDPNYRNARGTASHCVQHRTAALVRSLDPDAVFGLGDLQNDDGTLAKYREVYDDSWGTFKDITFPVIGNHEYWAGSPDGYFDYWKDRPSGQRGKGWYSVRLGEWEIYALNANCAYPYFRAPSCDEGSEQWQWLRDRLRESDAACQLAMWHEPRVSSGPHGPYGRLEPLWRLLVDARVELVLSAHDELYERFAPIGRNARPDPEGVRQFVVGTGGDQLYTFADRQPGSQVREDDSFGVLEMSLDPEGYAWRFRSAGPGGAGDRGSDVCATP